MDKKQQKMIDNTLAQRLKQRLDTGGPLKLGTRRSPLAMAQAKLTRDALRDAFGLPDESIELVPVIASGDRIQDRALADLGGKALWTRELDRALLDREIDAAVHSMKDVETLRSDDFALVAMLERADVRDVLLGAPSIESIPQGALLGTSSPRRAAQMLSLRPDMRCGLFRGNVATRMAKLEAGEADVTLLAAAGLARLDQAHIGAPLDAERWLPAAAQGAIGIECRSDDALMRAILAQINHQPTYQCVMAERALLEALGGNCHSPIGVLSRIENDRIRMKAAIFSEDGSARQDSETVFAADDTDGPAQLAQQLLTDAPPAITCLFAPEQ